MSKTIAIRLSVAILTCIASATIATAAEKKPNFIIIFTDDQGYQDVGCFGSPNIETPNLDRMAAEGVRFTSFYSVCSVCSPSRAGLLTGCYPPRTGVTRVLFPRDKVGLNPDETTIAELLKARGYATACIGKWHIGHHEKFLPTNHGFDYYFGIPYSNDMDRVKKMGLDDAWKAKDFSPWNVPLMRNTEIIERPADQRTLTKRYADEAIKFIETNKDQPFFLYLPHTMPHIPLFVLDENHKPDPKQAYKATIEEIDWAIGRVLKALKDCGVDDNTLVVFTTDNGPWLSMKHHGGSALPLRAGKFTTFEGGMRVPMIARWPGRVATGRTCDEVAATMDLLPTFVKLAGGAPPADRTIDGKDIWPLLAGESSATSPHEAFYYYKGTTLEGVRRGKWKLNLASKGNRGRELSLHDLEADISEKNNLAQTHPEIVAELTEMIKSFDAKLKADARPIGKLEDEKK